MFRTTSASTVSSSSGWTELTGVSSAVNSSNGTKLRSGQLLSVVETMVHYIQCILALRWKNISIR
jgi:hypothetical protein